MNAWLALALVLAALVPLAVVASPSKDGRPRAIRRRVVEALVEADERR